MSLSESYKYHTKDKEHFRSYKVVMNQLTLYCGGPLNRAALTTLTDTGILSSTIGTSPGSG